jgi:hypothetical protein
VSHIFWLCELTSYSLLKLVNIYTNLSPKDRHLLSLKAINVIEPVLTCVFTDVLNGFLKSTSSQLRNLSEAVKVVDKDDVCIRHLVV